MTKMHFLNQNPLILNKIHTETNNHTQAHKNKHNN